MTGVCPFFVKSPTTLTVMDPYRDFNTLVVIGTCIPFVAPSHGLPSSTNTVNTSTSMWRTDPETQLRQRDCII
jgi:hypothetical protein